jgi:uridine monophosphate synthetase
VLSQKAAAVADKLFEVGAVQFGAFRLKLHETQPDAPLSPIYLNLRTSDNPKPGPLTPQLVKAIAEMFYEMLCSASDVEFRYVAGLPRAGDPLADALMECFAPSDLVQLRLAKREDEGGRRIVGIYDNDYVTSGKVLMVDDLITKADTKLEAVEVLENCGLEVRDLVVLVDREQGGTEWLREEEGIEVHAAFTLSLLLDHYVTTRKIEQSKADEVKAYQAASRG